MEETKQGGDYKRDEAVGKVVLDSQNEHALLSGDHAQHMERNFSFLAALGMAFAMLNSWTAMSASLSLVLPSGTNIYGLWIAGFCHWVIMHVCISSRDLSCVPSTRRSIRLDIYAVA